MVLPRLAAGMLLLLALAAGATSAVADTTTTAPTGLHGFLLRADEPQKDSFNRTPAFAWNPVPGAARYELQLSTSNAFRDNGVIWQSSRLQSPVAAPALTLPWITGSPHALYARVRGIFSGGVTDWSDSFGFDLTPPPPPTPLKSAPGLLRWTPIEGANGYQVWLLDARKSEAVFTNVLDERDFYTFHQSAPWIGTIRWRIRAFRNDYSVKGRQNGMPITQYGSWSPIYQSTNPAPTTGAIHLGTTISDVVADGGPASAAHRLMPAFTWTGNQTQAGEPAELFRVYIFTDKQCLNRVFTGGVVGGPAYAARPYGGLSLPAGSIDAARSAFLADGSEPKGTTVDSEQVTSSEGLDQATPTTTLPMAQTGVVAPTTGGSGGDGDQPAAQSSAFITWSSDSKFGAPVDLWDTNWPEGGYYWTVVPVKAVSPGALLTNVATPGGIATATSIPISNSDGFAPGDTVLIGPKWNQEPGTVISAEDNALGLAKPLASNHGPGEPVLRTGGSLLYTDLELPQDVCAAGRVARFGINSEPSLVAGGDLFASGLSPGGKLTSAVHTASFYRPPLVSWTQALGATVYQVQWSKTQSPFNPEPDPASKAQGILTGATSYVLPLTPGTWYYRVRGYDYSLPTGAQQMGWSDVATITVTQPTFTVVGGTPASTIKTTATKKKATAPKKKAAPKKTSTSVAMTRYDESDFSISLPKGWRTVASSDADIALRVRDAKSGANVAVSVSKPLKNPSLSAMAEGLKQEFAHTKGFSSVRTAIVRLPAGKAVLVTARVKLKAGSLATDYQYYVNGEKHSYVITLVTPVAYETQHSKIAGSIAASFRIG